MHEGRGRAPWIHFRARVIDAVSQVKSVSQSVSHYHTASRRHMAHTVTLESAGKDLRVGADTRSRLPAARLGGVERALRDARRKE